MAYGTPKTYRAQTSMVEIVALIVVIVIVAWFFVGPQASKLKTQKSQLKQAQAEFQSVEQDKNGLNQLITNLHQAPTDIALVDEALPLDNRPTELEVLIDGLVTASGMTASDLGLHQEDNSIAAGNKALLTNPYSATRKLQTTTVDLSVDGTVDQFKNLLQLLETNGRIIDVTGLNMSNGTDKTLFKLKLKAYSYVP
jgi:Tfp pilus assembly protein PilO